MASYNKDGSIEYRVEKYQIVKLFKKNIIQKIYYIDCVNVYDIELASLA